MTINFVNTGTLVSAATTVAPPYPAGIVAGDLAIMTIVTGSPTESIPSLPAGWDLAVTKSGGGGSYGSGTGPRRVSMYAHTYAAGETAPTTSIATDTGTLIAARIIALHGTIGKGWRYSGSAGEMTVASTSFSVTGGDNETFFTNDFAVAAYGIRTNAPSLITEALAASGITFGTITERADDSIAVNNLARLGIATGSVTTGALNSQVTTTISATLGAAHTGVGAVLRVREATTSIVATTQNANPPRNQVVVSGMAAEEIATVTIERVTGDVIEGLRGAIATDVTGDDALVRVDGEMQFGTQISYIAVLVDVLGNEWEISSNSISSDITHEILSDATLALGVECQIMDWKEKNYERESSTFNVSGRIVVVSGPQPLPSSTITLFTKTTADRNAMIALLANATNGTVQIRTHATTICFDDPGYDSHAMVDSYLQVKSNVLERAGKFRYPQRIWAIDVVETEPWSLAIEARGFTLQDIANHYVGRSLQAIRDDFTPGTMLDIATHDWSV